MFVQMNWHDFDDPSLKSSQYISINCYGSGKTFILDDYSYKYDKGLLLEQGLFKDVLTTFGIWKYLIGNDFGY